MPAVGRHHEGFVEIGGGYLALQVLRLEASHELEGRARFRLQRGGREPRLAQQLTVGFQIRLTVAHVDVDEVDAVGVEDGEGLGAAVGARLADWVSELQHDAEVAECGLLEVVALPDLW